jgi:hypothetical protein
MKRSYQHLTDEQVEQFLTHGFIMLNDCFDKDVAKRLRNQAFDMLGYKFDDPSTWDRPYLRVPINESFSMHEFAPKAWNTACDLLGGEDRVVKPCWMGSAFILNLAVRADEPWLPPGPDAPGYHKDGDFFRHFLDSPEQGLLTLVYWSDTKSQCGGTFVISDSIKPIARYLADHPEGILPTQGHFGAFAHECHEFTEVYGNTGDIALIHPYLLHATSQNMRRIPRFLTNPPIGLKEPMQFNRENPEDFSPVELAILRALGVDRLDFKPTHEREHVVPARIQREKELMEEIRKRKEMAAQAG